MIEALLAEPRFWIAAAVVLVGGLIRGFAGFGSALLIAPVFAVLFGPVEAVATIVGMELAVSLQLARGAWRDCEPRLVGLLTLTAVATMPAGAWVLVTLDPRLLARAVAAIVIAFAIVRFAGWRYTGRKHPAVTAGVGLVSGLLMATTTVGGPPVLVYLLSSDDAPRRSRANIIMYFLMTMIPLIAILAVADVFTAASLARAALLLPVLLGGAWLGGRMFGLADERLYRNVALTIVLAAGLFGLLS